jgi:hypothetical protein
MNVERSSNPSLYTGEKIMAKKTLMVEADERLCGSTEKAIKTTLDNLFEAGKIKSFELLDLPESEPQLIAKGGIKQACARKHQQLTV